MKSFNLLLLVLFLSLNGRLNFKTVLSGKKNQNIEDLINMDDLTSFMENIPNNENTDENNDENNNENNNENNSENNNEINELAKEYYKAPPPNLSIKRENESNQKNRQSSSDLQQDSPKVNDSNQKNRQSSNLKRKSRKENESKQKNINSSSNLQKDSPKVNDFNKKNRKSSSKIQQDSTKENESIHKNRHSTPIIKKSGNKSIEKNKKLNIEIEKNLSNQNYSIQKNKQLGPEKIKYEKQKEIAENSKSKFSIKMIPNSKLNVNGETIPKFETFSPCIQKTGFLGFVKTYSTKTKIIEAKPIYVSINIYHLSFFESTEDSTLFKAIKLRKIISVSQKYRDTLCFDINIKNQKNVTLCGKNMNDMKDWISAIEDFKKCPLKNNRNLILDFKNLNKMVKKNKNISKKNFAINHLFYDTKKMPRIRPKVTKMLKAGITMKRILETIKLGNMAKNQLKRKYENKLKVAKKFTREVSKKQKMLRKLMLKRASKANIQKYQEFKLLEAFQRKIRQLKVFNFLI